MPVHAHLTAEARVIADLDDARRIAHLAEDHWIDYPRARQALQELERLLACPERTRMPGLLLHGESNIGKSMVIQKFVAAAPCAAVRPGAEDAVGSAGCPAGSRRSPSSLVFHRRQHRQLGCPLCGRTAVAGRSSSDDTTRLPPTMARRARRLREMPGGRGGGWSTYHVASDLDEPTGHRVRHPRHLAEARGCAHAGKHSSRWGFRRRGSEARNGAAAR